MNIPVCGIPAADLGRLRELAAAGCGYREIARQLHRPRTSVAKAAQRLGIVVTPAKSGPPKQAPKPKPPKATRRRRPAPPAPAPPPKPQAPERREVWAVPLTARPWQMRERGQCAWPVGPRDEEGAHDSLSCCRPSGRDSYCPMHRAAMALPARGALSDLAMGLAPRRRPAPDDRLAAAQRWAR